MIGCNAQKRVTVSSDYTRAFLLNNFLHGGTTNGLWSMCADYKTEGADKTLMSDASFNSLVELIDSLEEKKHFQKKIASVDGAFEICDASGCKCFVVTENTFINISDSMEYSLTKSEYNKLRELLKKPE